MAGVQGCDILTPIQQFYYGQNVLITGGTGFVGKILIEKLLRSCPGIGTIYVLIRSKKDCTPQERIAKLCQSNVFKKLKEENSLFAEGIVGIPGDCSLPNLGISNSNRSIIIQNVSIVFHAAATVRFDETLKNYIFTNVRGCLEIINLCKELPRLKAAIHVSTAYSFCTRDTIQEKIYDDLHIKGRDLIEMADFLGDNLSSQEEKKLIGKWPNSYTFTKAAAEQIVQTEAGHLPFGILRPAIIAASYHEPMEGWVDSFLGPTGLVCSASIGALRTVYASDTSELNIVPCDLVVNAILASAWDVFNVKSECEDRIPIYNFVANGNGVLVNDVIKFIKIYTWISPSQKVLWYCNVGCTPNKMMHTLYIYVCHLLPALLLDTLSILRFKEPSMMKMYRGINKMLNAVDYFTYTNWSFTNYNMNELVKKLNKKDRKLFCCDMREVDWHAYFKIYIEGIRTYLLNDPMDTVPPARQKLRRLYWISQFSKILCYCMTIGVSWLVISNLLRIVMNKLQYVK